MFDSVPVSYKDTKFQINIYLCISDYAIYENFHYSAGYRLEIHP